MTGTSETQLDTAMAERIRLVQDRIVSAASAAGRSPSDVRLVAVCKTVDRDAVDAAYSIGLRDFGENRVQDARSKFSESVPDELNLHLIGPLQRNKARQVVGLCGLIHTLDRESLADEIDKRAQAAGIVQPVLIQVNVGREEQKHGCDIEHVPALIEHTLSKPGLTVRGFMTMAPLSAEPEETRPVFAEMREIAANMRDRYPEAPLDELSMGMTNDFPVAIEEGATLVRVGRAIFHEENKL